MIEKRHIRWLCLLLVVFTASVVLAAGHGEKAPKKNAILLVAFGTSVPEAQKAFKQIEAQVKKAFPGVEVRWAFTSSIIRKKLAKEGKKLDSPRVALAKLLEDGYTHILVSSFHSLPGAEFHDLYEDVAAFRQMNGAHNRMILVSRPLLSSRENMEASVKALIKSVPQTRKPDEAVVVMGHGSEHHPGDAVYAATAYFAQEIDPNFFVGTVEGQPTLADLIPKLKKKRIKKVYLLPFMAVAGDHARNDMCGNEEDSWKSTLEKKGFAVECILKGTAENPEIVDLWIKNMKKAYAHFK